MDGSDNTPLEFTIITTNMVVEAPNRAPQYHSFSNIEPCCAGLPGTGWDYHKTDDLTIMFCELILANDSETLRIKRRVASNLARGICTSYVMYHMISGINALDKIDIERCMKELHMLNICVGGPSASKFVPLVGLNCYVDAIGNWRNSSCKVFTDSADFLCSACEPLQYRLIELELANGENGLYQSNDTRGQRAIITNFSHQRQNQIEALRDRCALLYRKKRKVEKEMREIEEMIYEMSEEPEQTNLHMEDDDDDDNE